MKTICFFILMFLTLNSFSKKEEFITIVENPATSVKNQGGPGCWSYAACSFVESELLRMKKGAYDLSEDFFVYYAYINKAHNYVLRKGNTSFRPGGLAHDVLRIIKEKGIIPQQYFKVDSIQNNKELERVLVSYLKTILEDDYPTENWMKHYCSLLDSSYTKVRNGLSATSLGQVKLGSFQNIGGKIWHTVKLTNLTPGTRYYYRCISGVDSSVVYPFRSEPVSGTPGQHVRLILFGDSRYRDTVQSKLAFISQAIQTKMQTKYGSGWYDSINAVMHTGDIVWNGTNIDRFQNEFFTPISNLSCSVPIMVAIGNHEHESAFYFDYMKYEEFTDSLVATTAYKERFYSFNILDCQLLVLNSNEHIISVPIQTNWLTNVLTESNSAPGIDFVFPFAHHLWHTEVWSEGNVDSVRIVFFPQFLNFNKVSQYSFGHAHDFELGTILNTNPPNNSSHDLRTHLAGDGGAELTRYFAGSHDYPEIQETIDDYNYTLLDVDVDNKSYTAEVYSLGKPEHPIDNQILDVWHFRINQPPPDKPVVNPITTTNPVILSATPMAGVDSCLSSQFEITISQGNYTTPILDTIRNWEDVFGNTGLPDFIPINKNAGNDLASFEVPDNILIPGTIYWFRFRYRDFNLKWSPWSDEGTITGIKNLNFSSQDFNLS